MLFESALPSVLHPHFSLWRNTLLNTHKHVSAAFFPPLGDRSGSHNHHLLRDIVSWTNFNPKNRNKTIIMIQPARKRRATACALSRSYYWELSYSMSCPFKPVINCVVVSPHRSLMNSELGPGEDYQANLISVLTPESHGATGEDVNEAATHPPCLGFLFLFLKKTRKKKVAMPLVNGSLGHVAWVCSHTYPHTPGRPLQNDVLSSSSEVWPRGEGWLFWHSFLWFMFPAGAIICLNKGSFREDQQCCSPRSDL